MNSIGVVSYAAASIAFLAITLLLMVSWRGRSVGVRLIVATALTSLWGAVLAWAGMLERAPLQAIYLIEMLRTGAWILVLVSLGREMLPRWAPWGALALWSALLLGGLFVSLGQFWAPAGIALSLTVLVIIEQIYRNANTDGRYAFKLMAIGLGGLFAYDLFLYSQAEMMRGISAEIWAARGFVNALIVPLIAISTRRNPGWSLRVFVSRQTVVFTTAIAAAGAYLLAMAFGGYVLHRIGGSWGPIYNLIFLAGALIVLAMTLLSGSVRRRLRVFVAKHFYSNKYDYRVEWLRFVETIDAGGESDIRRNGLRAVAQIFESPGTILYWRAETGAQYVPIAAWPMQLEHLDDAMPVPMQQEMMRFMGSTRWVIDLDEYRRSPDVYQNVQLPAPCAGSGRFRALVPLDDASGLAGFILMYAPPPPFELTYEDRDLLKTVGRHIATLTAQQESDRRLAESRQFEAYHRLTAFMMHDLKNSVAQLQLVVSNAERHRHNPAFVDDAIRTIGNAVERMTRLMATLRENAPRASTEGVRLAELLQRVVERCEDRVPRPRLDRSLPEGVVVEAHSDRLSDALEHVLRNAQDACDAGDDIAVSMRREGRMAIVSVADTGSGMSPDFVQNRLFRPFDSTKGARGMGIGAFQVREYLRSLGGEVEVQSSPGSGTRFDIILPLGKTSHE